MAPLQKPNLRFCHQEVSYCLWDPGQRDPAAEGVAEKLALQMGLPLPVKLQRHGTTVFRLIHNQVIPLLPKLRQRQDVLAKQPNLQAKIQGSQPKRCLPQPPHTAAHCLQSLCPPRICLLGPSPGQPGSHHFCRQTRSPRNISSTADLIPDLELLEPDPGKDFPMPRAQSAGSFAEKLSEIFGQGDRLKLRRQLRKAGTHLRPMIGQRAPNPLQERFDPPRPHQARTGLLQAPQHLIRLPLTPHQK